MKEIVFNEKKYNIPENWNEISIRMIVKVSEYSDLLPEAPVIAIIAGYTGIDVQDLRMSKLQEVQEIMKILDFIYVPYVPVASTGFVFNDKHYSANDDILDQNFEDWVNIQTILHNYKENPAKGLPRMIAVYCKQSDEHLGDFKLDERAEMFMDLPFPLAKNVEFFFLNSRIAQETLFLLSSTMEEQQKEVLNRFDELNSIMKLQQERNGIFSPTTWLIGIYRIYLKYLKKQLEASSSFQHINDLKKS